MTKKISLDFGNIEIKANLFESSTAEQVLNHLPQEIKLSNWGKEYYGSIGIDIEIENPVSEISAGGLAYSRRGNYFCIFLGQNPAWPVEHIGQIPKAEWEKLKEKNNLESVVIKTRE